MWCPHNSIILDAKIIIKSKQLANLPIVCFPLIFFNTISLGTQHFKYRYLGTQNVFSQILA